MLLVIFYTVHGILQARILEWVALPFSRESSQPRDWTQVSHIAGDSLPAEPQGKPKNTSVVSLSLLQGFFPTQELNQGLLHCRQILTNWAIREAHLTCLLRNLYAGQEAKVRTGYGTTDWFKVGKGVCQSYISSPCLFNLYAEYIKHNAGLDEA